MYSITAVHSHMIEYFPSFQKKHSTCEILGFCSAVVEVLNLLGRCAASLCECSARLRILLGHIDLWRWDHHVISKRREKIIQWCRVTYQKTEYLKWILRTIQNAYEIEIQEFLTRTHEIIRSGFPAKWRYYQIKTTKSNTRKIFEGLKEGNDWWTSAKLL